MSYLLWGCILAQAVCIIMLNIRITQTNEHIGDIVDAFIQFIEEISNDENG